MKSAVFEKAGHMVVQDVAKPQIQAPDDVIIKVIRACVCGSDLWSYRGLEDRPEHSQNNGHESIGLVDAVGDAITTLKPGDFVIAPFVHGCGHCAACLAGFEGGCLSHPHSDNFSSGNQAEYVRFQHGQWALVKVPGQPSDYSEGMLRSLLTLANVMATGYHAAKVAHVHAGDTVVVMGDGAVGQCGIIAAKMLGAKRIISTSRHPDRAALAQELGATDNVAERDADGVRQILALTNHVGADAVLECVGTELAFNTALQVTRPGATIGRVGLPHTAKTDLAAPFEMNITLAGGPASVTTYDKQVLLKAVLDGQIDPGKVFTKTFTLDQIDDAYQAMAQRQAIKSLVIVSQ